MYMIKVRVTCKNQDHNFMFNEAEKFTQFIKHSEKQSYQFYANFKH